MAWLPQSTKWRASAGAGAIVLVLGAIVGATRDDAASERGSAVAVDAASDGSGDVSTAPQHGVPHGGLSVTAAGGGGADVAGSAGDHAGSDGGTPLPGETALAASAGDRVVKTANLDVKLDDGGLDGARHDVLRIVDGLGGFISASNVSDGRATFTVRVPAEDFEKLLSRMRELGEVTSEEISGEDVSEEFVDLEARLRHWRAQEAVFLDLMARATTVSESIEVRRELSNIQQTIEQLEGRLRFLTDRVEMSTLTLHLVDPALPAKRDSAESGGLSEAWDDALAAGESVIGGTLVVLGALVPLAVIVGLPAAALWAALRRRRTPTPSPSAT